MKKLYTAILVLGALSAGHIDAFSVARGASKVRPLSKKKKIQKEIKRLEEQAKKLKKAGKYEEASMKLREAKQKKKSLKK
jgi:hypothetical protein